MHADFFRIDNKVAIHVTIPVHTLNAEDCVGVKTDGAFGGGPSEDIYRDLMNDELGKSMTGQGGIGMSDSIYREILKNQEVSK